MIRLGILLILGIGLSASAVGQVLETFDRLHRGNVTVKVNFLSGGMKVNEYDYKPGWGSYERDVTKSRTFQVEVIGQSTSDPASVEFYIAVRNSSKKLSLLEAGRKEAPLSSGTFEFTASVTEEQARWIYWDTHDRDGDSIVGWLVRVVRAGKVIGVAASSSKWLEAAERPESLSNLLLRKP